MIDNSDDPIIDACLDEVLGRQRPPNLTDRILRAWDDAGKIAADGPAPTPSATQTIASPATERTASVQVRNSTRPGNSRRNASRWLTIAASLAIIGLSSAIAWVAWNAIELPDQHSHQIAAPSPRTAPSHVTPVSPQESFAQVPPEPIKVAPNPALEQSVAPANSVAVEPAPSTQVQESLPEITIPDERPTPLADEQIVHAINELIRNGWQREGITPAKSISDTQWCERVYLKLIGRAPSPQEVGFFVDNRSARKREELVDLLLRGETYVEEFASHWSQTWTDILIASGSRQTQSNRDGLEQYLRQAFGNGKPFDQTTHELLTATGSGKVGSRGYNGAANFLLAHADAKGVYAETTVQVSRTFMAHSLECSQCHNDGVWSGNEQQKFWELNAFFRQLEMTSDRDRGWVISDTDLRDRSPSSYDGEIYYSLVNGLLKQAYPVFVDGTTLPHSPVVSQVNRRDLLAKFITRSEQFRQAMANRFWAELFGVGFTIPADNIGPHNPPSHPELLAKLGGQFAAHDYDVRKLIRWIALSEPFALSSGDVATHDQIGSKLVFDRFPQSNETRETFLKRLPVAQQAYASFSIKPGDSSNTARVAPAIVPGAVPTELADVDKFLATVTTEARRLSKATVYGNYILESNMSLEQKIQHMFFATLHRAPTANEQKAVEDLLPDGNDGASKAALEYIWWALATSQEAR